VHLCWLAKHHPRREVRGTSSGFATTASQISRLQQTQTSAIVAERKGTLWTATQLDKSNQPHKQRARPAFGPLLDAFNTRGVIDALYDAIDGVEDGCFLIRDNSSTNGTPTEGTEFVDGPMSAARADNALQYLLTLPPLALSVQAAREFTNRSLKPFMLKHAVRMGSDPLRRHGIGRFAGSAYRTRSSFRSTACDAPSCLIATRRAQRSQQT